MSADTPRCSRISKSRFSPLWRKLFITPVDCNVADYIRQSWQVANSDGVGVAYPEHKNPHSEILVEVDDSR
jgi:hypothetical protein